MEKQASFGLSSTLGMKTQTYELVTKMRFCPKKLARLLKSLQLTILSGAVRNDNGKCEILWDLATD